MEQKTVWANDVLKAIVDSRQRETELRESNEFYAKLYKIMK
jgi:hypothetical protein